MPNVPDHPTRSRSRPRARAPRVVRPALVVLLVTAVLMVSGCAWVGSAPTQAVGVPASVLEGITATLSVRTTAIRQGQPRRFAATVARGAMRRAQKRWFANVQQLPLAQFSQTAQGPVTETEGGYAVMVRTTLRLAGFDQRPVPTLRRGVFSASDQGWQLVSLAEPARGVRQPWDDGPIVASRHGEVLVIADAGSRDRSAVVAASVQRAMAQVRRAVPWEWPARVLVHAPSTSRSLNRLANLPGGSGERLDAVAYRVSGGADGQRFAASRLLLHPRLLTASASQRDRVLRHELTHVALGTRNDRLPMWLSEGIAEYVAADGLAPAQRMIAQTAIDDARSGQVRLPSDAEFRAAATGSQYGISWFACEAIAREAGQQTLWQIVTDLSARQQGSIDDVLRRRTGLDRKQLAVRAGTLIRATYP